MKLDGETKLNCSFQFVIIALTAHSCPKLNSLFAWSVHIQFAHAKQSYAILETHTRTHR